MTRISSLFMGVLVFVSTSLQAHVIPENTQQITVVVTDSWQDIQGQLQRFEISPEGQWQAVGSSFPVVIGRTGLAWGLGLHPLQAGIQKREGDGKAPAGVFQLDNAFGYLKSVETGLEYQAMDKGDYCIDVKDSPLYNQMVNTKEVGEDAVKGSSEAMRRDLHANDHLYKKGIIVKHNPDNINNAGSCIFMHLWRSDSKPTAGCTAMSEADMDALLAWLDQEKHPVMVIMPRMEYGLKQHAWQLPSLPVAQ